MTDLNHIRPSATVVLLRDNAQQLEVLMLRKNQQINYGGSWVFPGGVIDPEDYDQARELLGNDELQSAARITAARETEEEAGLDVCPRNMLPFAYWVTPKLMKKRYATWFYAADANHLEAEPVIDDGEIIEARWFDPAQALSLHTAGDVKLNGPSYITLSELGQFDSTTEALASYQKRGLREYKPRALPQDSGVISVYQEDPDYEAAKHAETFVDSGSSPQHRLYMQREGAWHYINDAC